MQAITVEDLDYSQQAVITDGRRVAKKSLEEHKRSIINRCQSIIRHFEDAFDGPVPYHIERGIEEMGETLEQIALCNAVLLVQVA